MAALRPQADIYAPMAALLETASGIKSYFGRAALTQNAAPPRYVWTVEGDEMRGPSRSRTDEQTLFVSWLTFDVHCWHSTFDGAWLMRANLLSAVNQLAVDGYEVGSLEVDPDQYPGIKGTLIIEPIAIAIPVLRVELDGTNLVLGTVDTVGIDSAIVDEALDTP